MYCIKCGKQRVNGENYCYACGNSFLVKPMPTTTEKKERILTSENHKRVCVNCGRKLGPCKNVQVKDKGYFCNNCWAAAGFNTWGDLFDKPHMYTSQDVVDIIKVNDLHQKVIECFEPTLDVCPAAKFNDDSREMILSEHILVYTTKDPQKRCPEHYSLFSYDQVLSFELLENGEGIASGGVGRAFIGGILFGAVGAVVGSTTRGYQSVCRELTIKITVKDYKAPAFYLPLIVLETNKSSFEYKEKMKIAQDILSKLQLITNKVEDCVNLVDDKFAEIRNYKMLLDDGIITQEEFEKKKRELLHI